MRSHDEGFAVLRERLAGAVSAWGDVTTARAVARLVCPSEAGGRDLPVLAWLDDALARAAEDVDADIADALGALARSVRWQQTASYVEHPPDASFLDRYGHATVAGTDDLTLGLLLLGPDVHYPRHHHPAEEFYLPAGTIRWTHATDDAPVPEPAGVLLHHAPWQPHALLTDERPVLLAWVWTGEVGTPSAFC